MATKRTRGVILNSPCNPTGAVIAESELAAIVEWCSARELFLIFDETYEFFVYDGARHVSAIKWFEEHPETVIVVNSMSKTFAMTGWRLGYAVAHPELIQAAGKIQSHSTSNPSSISQAAALEALRGDESEVRRMFEAYRERRGWLVPALNRIKGFCCLDPDGAFYLCNNGGSRYVEGTSMGQGPHPDYKFGSIQRIDPQTGEHTTLYTACNGHKLSAPNDLVFDGHGGFYFTNLGKRYARHRDYGGVYYARSIYTYCISRRNFHGGMHLRVR